MTDGFKQMTFSTRSTCNPSGRPCGQSSATCLSKLLMCFFLELSRFPIPRFVLFLSCTKIAWMQMVMEPSQNRSFRSLGSALFLPLQVSFLPALIGRSTYHLSSRRCLHRKLLLSGHFWRRRPAHFVPVASIFDMKIVKGDSQFSSRQWMTSITIWTWTIQRIFPAMRCCLGANVETISWIGLLTLSIRKSTKFG